MRALLLSGVLLLAACGPGTSTVGSTGGTGGPGSDAGGGANQGSDAGNGSGQDAGGAGPDAGVLGDGCSDQAKLVYVIDANNTFSSFHPGASPTFTDIGKLSCPAQFAATPFSMSVDRNATAWVLYSSGEIFKVDTATLSCIATSYQSGQQGFITFGMGFVATAVGSATDRLYLANNASSGELGVLNTGTLQISTLGPLSGKPELTGTGDARLFGFFPDPSNPRVSQLGESTGAEGTRYPLQALAGNPMEYAFAFWGGDFWIFLTRDAELSTNVWHLQTSDGGVSEVLSNTGRNIVGAGVSTCAPFVAQ